MLFPLGELSYFTALAAWQLLPLLGFLLVMSRMGIPWALFFLLPLSGAVVQNIAAGQNGSLSAFFLAGALLTLERRPIVAGVLFGLMTFKPQLALLIAPTLLFGRHWRALIVLAVTVLEQGVWSEPVSAKFPVMQGKYREFSRIRPESGL